MMRKPSISFLLLAALTCGAGCGTDDEATRRTIVGPKVTGSVWHGLAVAAVSTDQSLPTGRLYYFEFASGELRGLRLRRVSENLDDVELGGVPYAAVLIPKPKP
jgi:hypothetical protein